MVCCVVKDAFGTPESASLWLLALLGLRVEHRGRFLELLLLGLAVSGRAIQLDAGARCIRKRLRDLGVRGCKVVGAHHVNIA